MMGRWYNHLDDKSRFVRLEYDPEGRVGQQDLWVWCYLKTRDFYKEMSDGKPIGLEAEVGRWLNNGEKN